MPLVAGARLGPYEILAAIGAGGMGEVYRARDTKLHRDVAVKVLPDLFAADPERLARFEREAQVLASLNHPNIAHVYGVEDRALVMEFVEGEDLAQRLSRGPIPIDEALAIARQIADALEAAHEHGIVHRDLKPANIKVRPDGAVKVLDFGLAKALEPAAFAGEALNSPTFTAQATQQGIVIGTAAYMPPEQARGKAVDKRADIWAFGCVLYEMLGGRQTFGGDTITDVLAAVVRQDPDWSTLPADTPSSVRRLLQRCLQKDPARRLRDISDARFELLESDASPAPIAAVPPARARQGPVPWMAIVVTAALAAAASAAAVAYLRRPGADPPELRLQVMTPITPAPTSLALSPDGRHLVFVATRPDSTQAELWLRDLDTVSNQRLPGTEGASFPFWSGDGRNIGFFADSKLQRYELAGGAVQTLAAAPLGRGGSWSRDGAIIFAPTVGGLMRVAAGGGEAVPLTQVHPPHETSHRFPQFLPDGHRFLYFVQGSTEKQGVYLASLDEPNGHRLFAGDTHAVFAAPDRLLFVRQGTAFAQRLNLSTGSMTGDPVKVADQVVFDGAFNSSALTASQTGLIAYRTGSANQLIWMDRTGKPLGTATSPEPNAQNCPEISPDGRRVALDRTVGGNRDIWLIELARNVSSRFTFDTGIDATPIWSPDGARIAFRSNRTGVNQIYVRPSNGTAPEALLTTLPIGVGLADWSRDGRTLLFLALDPKTALDLWALPLAPGGKPFPVAQTPFEERDGQFSPDGRWIAYASNESGRMEVYVQAFPQGGQKWQVSTTGAAQPRWRGDGAELFFVGTNGMMMSSSFARRPPGAPPVTGTPVGLFAPRIVTTVGGLLRPQYAVSADGKRFLLNAVSEGAASAPITVIANWAGFKQP